MGFDKLSYQKRAKKVKCVLFQRQWVATDSTDFYFTFYFKEKMKKHIWSHTWYRNIF